MTSPTSEDLDKSSGLPTSDLAKKHPMTIKDELLPRAVKLLAARGRDRVTDPPSDLTWREFKTDRISITECSDGVFLVGVDRSNKWARIAVDAIRCKDGLILNYDHDNAVEALEEMRRLMVLDDLASI